MKLGFLTGVVAALAMSSTAYATFNVDDVGINITNDGSMLVGDVPQFNPQNAQAHYDFVVAQIAGYNSFTDPDLPGVDGTSGSDIFLQDDNADTSGNNGSYVLPAGCFYYVSVHYGRGNALWYVEGSDAMTFEVPENGSDFGGPNSRGLSNVRIFKAKGGESVPDGGSTLVLLGASLLLAPLRRVLRRK